jgi:hypothetical protein
MCTAILREPVFRPTEIVFEWQNDHAHRARQVSRAEGELS